MFYNDAQIKQVLDGLGDRLRIRRVMAKESQQVWADKLSVSVPTYRRMEKGAPSVPFGHWLHALALLGELEKVDQLISLTTK